MNTSPWSNVPVIEEKPKEEFAGFHFEVSNEEEKENLVHYCDELKENLKNDVSAIITYGPYRIILVSFDINIDKITFDNDIPIGYVRLYSQNKFVEINWHDLKNPAK